jgi:2-polyprenyl-6-methoxyphenol hydroxylase-like FAD-dependent oxidoreductase
MDSIVHLFYFCTIEYIKSSGGAQTRETKMQRNRLKVLIIGAGTGGLALAQGLKAAGIAVEVYERERTPIDRAQGYRLSVNPAGCRALKACLPAPAYAKFLSNSAKPSETVTFLDHRLNRLLAIEIPRHEGSDVDNERPIARVALRGVLLDGLDQVVRFAKKFVAYEDEPDGSVTARFDDGSSATGNVLIGADGASSPVRGLLLPHARRIETGIAVISGKLGLNGGGRDQVPMPILRGPTLILGPEGHFMFANAVEYERGVNSAISDGAQAQDRDEYVMWGLSARAEAYGATPIEALGGEALKAAALGLMIGWSPVLRRLVENADASTFVTFRVKSSTPVEPWPTRNVTLLGDALHNMTPFRGVGANTALRDADALRRTLIAVDRGEQNLLPAIAAYERDMIDYGFKAVGASLQMMRRVHVENPLKRAVAKLIFRTVDHIKPLQPMLMGRE